MAIAARGRTVGERALGVLAYAGPLIAVGLATLGTAGLAAPMIGGIGASGATQSTVGSIAAAASADGDPTNEIRAVAERTINLVEREGNVVEYALKGPRGQMNVMTEMDRKGNTIILRGTHIEGAGPGSQGLRELREFARLFAREQGAMKIVIEGGMRTTGANPGHIPKDIIISVK